MIDELFDGIEQAVDVVDQAIFSNDFSSMSRDIGDIFKEQAKRRELEAQERARIRAEEMKAKQPGWATGKPPKQGNISEDAPGWTRSTGKKTYKDSPYWANNQAGNVGSKVDPHQAVQQQYTYHREKPITYSTNDQARHIKERFAQAMKKDKAPVFIRSNKVGGGNGMLIVGLAGLLVFGAAGAVAWADGFILSRILGAGLLAIGVLFGGLGISGFFQRAKKKHLEAYAALLKEKKYAPVQQLAEAAGISEKKAVKELKELAKSGVFPQGHFDKAEKTFMITDEMYNEYKEVQRKAEELKAVEEAEDAEYAGYKPKVKAILKKGKAYGDFIREANDDIADPYVTDKLTRMEQIVKRIFEAVAEKPERADKLNMLMDYYMPTTQKLISAYRDMIREPIQGESLVQAEKEIEESLDTFNEGFEGILDSFFEDEAMDLSTDISVMKTVMRQQGLTEGELKAEEAASGEWENGPTLDELKAQIDEQAMAMATEEIRLK
ncbi:MAG: 5-bromo-4-chloroindolyl phosphate hydrolysis family protein [Lachnospiraceae bacterium]|nr:5-bromo-4-chloroindolyl phosphate hydrolysis family protein [Candidatus Equihabitans merdae]